VAATRAFEEYKRWNAYICQPATSEHGQKTRTFRPNLKRLAFYHNKQIEPVIPKIDHHYLSVPFTAEEEARLMGSAGPDDRRLAQIIGADLTPGSPRAGHEWQVFLLSAPGDRTNTLQLRQANRPSGEGGVGPNTSVTRCLPPLSRRRSTRTNSPPLNRGANSSTRRRPQLMPPIHCYVAGTRIANADKKLLRYLCNRQRTLAQFDGLAGTLPTITPALVSATRVVNSRITKQQESWLIGMGTQAPWGLVPPSADLVAADPAQPGGLYNSALMLGTTSSHRTPSRCRYGKAL